LKQFNPLLFWHPGGSLPPLYQGFDPKAFRICG
jgi:hypothetical protein